jgi:hypothetical protein
MRLIGTPLPEGVTSMVQEAEIRSDFHPLFYDELGRLVVAVGRIEYALKLCIKDLKGEGFTAGMLFAESTRNFSDLCSKVIELSEAKYKEPDRTFFRGVVEAIRELGGERNDMIHALWTVTKDRVALRVRPERIKKTKSVDWKKTRPIEMKELTELRRTLESSYAVLEDCRQSFQTRTS